MANSVTSRSVSRSTSRRSSVRSARSLSHSKRNSREPSAASSGTKHKPRGTPKDPIHILTRDTPIGWAVIQRAVDEFDKDQIEGVKNDIDTLLVFIGLFSAVLSAFLVVAVALLQEDIPGATLTTLRQMSAQNANYTIQGDFIISTSPASTSSPPFEPSVNAIRINDLWAASLVISLATASFGILVKQWLREYMKFVTSFPQGRLRIRSFRRAGLETWKVLTIAACLPLLLQLALGLFFVGLCFYTAELHSSVRNTTLPLVAGWGFIFFFVTISPLFFAHCPYKTPALDSLVVSVRHSVRIRWKSLLRGMKTRAYNIHWGSPLRGRMAKVIYFWARQHVERLDTLTEPYDEVTAAKHEAGDLEIMVAADALQGNDEIVGTAMVDALQQITPKQEDIIRFVLQILQHRVPWEGKFEDPPQVIDCSMATIRALDSIHSILARHLRITEILLPSDSTFKSGTVASWTAALYLSLRTHHEFAKVHSPPWEALNKRHEIFAAVTASVPSAIGLKLFLHLTCQSCQESKLDLAQSLTRIKSVVEPFFIKLGLTDSFESNNYDAPWRRVLNKDSLGDTARFLTNLLRDDTAAQNGEWSDAQHDALAYIIKLTVVDRRPSEDRLASLWRMIFSSKPDAVAGKLLTMFIKSYPDSFYLYVHNEDFRTNTAALSRVAVAIETIATNSPDQFTRLSVLKACTGLAMSMYHVRDDVKSTALTESWRGIFDALASLVQAAPVLEGDTNEEASKIHSCFNWLSGVDARNEDSDRDNEKGYSAWRAAFRPEESPIPDGFYLALMDISTPEERFWRMRRLQEMNAEEREAAKRDVEPYLRKCDADNLDSSAAGPSTERGEGSGGGAGTTDRTRGVNAPDALKAPDVPEDGGDSGSDSEGADAPRSAEEPGNSGDDPDIVAGGPEPDEIVDLVLKAGGGGFGADSSHDDEHGGAILEDTADLNQAAIGLLHTNSSEDAPPEAEAAADNLDGLFETKDDARISGSAGEGGGRLSTDWVEEGIPDDTSPESVVPEPGDNPDVLKIQDDEQGHGPSGGAVEKVGTDLGHDKGIVDVGLRRSEHDHIMTFR